MLDSVSQFMLPPKPQVDSLDLQVRHLVYLLMPFVTGIRLIDPLSHLSNVHAITTIINITEPTSTRNIAHMSAKSVIISYVTSIRIDLQSP